ncbi:MAG TPA: winged helix-turn-helix domain-containing protein [Nitrosopumilaceae archaeon]|nr:winged helix-turn-helix domain-containing protein [Nitrosopumilaceae archaeon]
MEIVEKQAVSIYKAKKLLQIVEKQAIPIPVVKKIIRIIEKQAIPISEVKKIIRIIETAKAIPKKEFNPSMKILLRILRNMTENGADVKTSLAIKTNLNYARLAEHIVWLEKKGLVKSTRDKSKINVALTQQGRIFVTMLVT